MAVAVLTAGAMGRASAWAVPEPEAGTRDPEVGTPEPEAGAPDPQESKPARPSGKLDLRLKGGLTTLGLEGTWVYQPLDGTDAYTITIQKSKDGFFQYEGHGRTQVRPVLQLDRAEENMLFRGQVGEGFDACIPAGARFSLFLGGETLVFEPSMPVDAPVPRTPPGGACGGGTSKYFLAARGRGEEVRLRPQSDLAGAATAPDPRSEPSGNPPGTRRVQENAPGANLSIGAPTAPDGTQVLLLGSVRDGNLKVWHHVKLLAPLEPRGEHDASGRAGENQDGSVAGESGGTRHGGGGPDPGSSAADGPFRSREGRDAESDVGKHSNGGGASGSPGIETSKKAKAKDAKLAPAEPPSGYVPASSLVMRWECRLVRAVGGGTEPAKEVGP